MESASSRLIGFAVGLCGFVFFFFRMLPWLPDSILLGCSIGLMLSSTFWHHVRPPVRPQAQARGPGKESREVKIPLQAPTRSAEEKVVVKPSRPSAEMVRALDKFDKLLPTLGGTHGSNMSADATREFTDALSNLNKLYPEWNGEGRLRTYVILKEVSRLINDKNADAYLNIVNKTLQVRNSEAAELSRVLLKDKLEKMYLDPAYANASSIPGTLILMNMDEEDGVNGIVMDAIHLWDESRFRNTKPELEMLNRLAQKEKASVIDMLEKEIVKSKKAKDTTSLSRAKEILSMMGRPALETVNE